MKFELREAEAIHRALIPESDKLKAELKRAQAGDVREAKIRRELTDVQWERISNLVPGKKGDRGRPGEDNRLFMDAVLWMLRTGAPWRDLPAEFGNWNSVFTRFNRWSQKGVWESLFKALADDPDFEHVMIDATIVRAHQHAAGAKGGGKIRQSVGRVAA